MDKFIGYALLAVALFYVYNRFVKRSSSQSRPPQKSPANERTPAEQPPPIEITFEEKWRTGPLHCDGVVCNPNHPCNGAERWLCRDVITKIVPEGHFSGQFELELPSGDRRKNRRVDFAIETPEGKRIVVEIDGYEAHVKNLTYSAFNDQLLRQNELTCAGWTVLRFSFSQLAEDAEWCRRILHSAMTYPTITYRGKEFKFNKTPVLKGYCPNSECGGQVERRLSREAKFFWKCLKCEKTFNDDVIAPENKLGVVSTLKS